MRRLIGLVAPLAMLALASGCPSREVAEVDPRPTKEGFKDIPVQINRDIDILFVIDNSGSMLEEQTSLAANFQRFIAVLESIEGGLPNVNIGVISTDVGAGPFPISGCTGNGDNGVLQSARGPNAPVGCTGPNGAFIQDWDDGSGGRIRNYDTAQGLANTFSCIAQLGTSGCGFEQQLESMRRALNGSVASNAEFTARESAFLAVIFITDEDDCSTQDTAMFDTASTTVSDPLGPLSSYRCFEYGVDCAVGNNDRRAVGPRMDCSPRVDSPYMYHPDEYIDFLKSVKTDPNQIIVAGIIGNDTPVVVGADTETNNPELNPSCVTAAGEAAPGIRMNHFISAFPQRNTITTICNEDLSDALILIATMLAEVIGNPCIEGNILTRDGDPPFECQVSDVSNPGLDNQTETIIPYCEGADYMQACPPPDGPSNFNPPTVPCWRMCTDTASCGGTDTNLALRVERGSGSVPPNTHTQVRCVVD